MRGWVVVFSALLFALMLSACGGGGAGVCTVDCSNMFTGKIDIRNYTFSTKEDCIKKGEEAECPTKWCVDGTCESVY